MKNAKGAYIQGRMEYSLRPEITVLFTKKNCPKITTNFTFQCNINDPFSSNYNFN